MRKYQSITLDGQQVGHSTVRGLKLAIRRGKQKGGTFKCQCPGGNVHIWSIEITSVHSGVGYAPRRKAARVGKGHAFNNVTAKFLRVES